MTARPGTIRAVHTVDLPRPRSESTKDLDEFYRLLSTFRKELK